MVSHIEVSVTSFFSNWQGWEEGGQSEIKSSIPVNAPLWSLTAFTLCALLEYWFYLWLCALLGKTTVSQTGSTAGRRPSLPRLFWGFIPFHTGWWWESDAPLQLAITWCLSLQRTSNKWVYGLQRDHSPTTERHPPLEGSIL